MIRLTRLDGSEIFINAEQIELVEETPDSHVTLLNGNQYVVLETAAVILDRIITYKAAILHRSMHYSNRKYLQRKRVENSRPVCPL